MKKELEKRAQKWLLENSEDRELTIKSLIQVITFKENNLIMFIFDCAFIAWKRRITATKTVYYNPENDSFSFEA